MKTKLYKKVIRKSWKQLYSDFRPSSHYLIVKAIKPYCYPGSLKINVLPKEEQDARAAFIVWTERVCGGSLRYNLREEIEHKFRKRSRKWWTSSAKLRRAIEGKNIV